MVYVSGVIRVRPGTCAVKPSYRDLDAGSAGYEHTREQPSVVRI